MRDSDETGRTRHRSAQQLSLFAVARESQSTENAPRWERVPIYRVTLVRESSVTTASEHMGSSWDVAEMVRKHLAGVDREHFVVVLLNRKNAVIGMNIVAVGSLTAAVVHPREVFKPAILGNAAAIICGHNHPSGDPSPSSEDRALTARLVQAGKVLGIEVLDHVIIGDGTSGYFSFADNKLMEGGAG
jgi:DNA repair protein RadC